MKQRTLVYFSALVFAACSGESDTVNTSANPVGDTAADAVASTPQATTQTPADQSAAAAMPPPQRARLTMPDDLLTVRPQRNATRTALFGDLHVHTSYSYDAFAFGTLATPYDAYRYALGETIKNPAGFDMTIRVPLDFYAVTDHGEFLGVSLQVADPTTEISKLLHLEYMDNLNAPENLVPGNTPVRTQAFRSFSPDTLNLIDNGTVTQEFLDDITRDAWADTIAAADQYYKPGEFTTFVGYEYTARSDDQGNLHRNVIFRDTDKLPAIPLSRLHSPNPEELWDWMDGLRAEGIESLAIPHNSNGSNGQMFKLVDWAGNPLDDAYAEQRTRNEPLIEITQIKGTSETHPMLSDTDEWAGFEIMPYRIATNLYSEPSGSYARQALLNGLSQEDKGMKNPFEFGFVGASDTHMAAMPDDETDFYGKRGLLDANPQLQGATPLSPEVGARLLETSPDLAKEFDTGIYNSAGPITWAASGIAGVWAEENTRESIYNAFRRKETFATTGTRIKVRFFGGYSFTDSMLEAPDMIETAYRDGVPMGSDMLPVAGSVPSFIAWATRDALSAPLQRLQIVKGWTVAGEHHEKVFDVACSDGLAVDPLTHRCPDNGASVNLQDCSISNGVGAAELKTVWTDPEFDPAVRAFYYVRVLENPTCRWSTWDAVREGFPPRPDFPATIQERAYTSPIWFRPATG